MLHQPSSLQRHAKPLTGRQIHFRPFNDSLHHTMGRLAALRRVALKFHIQGRPTALCEVSQLMHQRRKRTKTFISVLTAQLGGRQFQLAWA